MPYSAQYKKLIEKEEGISKTNINVRNLYRITGYTYADGTRKSLAGTKSAILFVFGKDAHNIYALKLNDVRPEKFLQWLSKLQTHSPVDLKKIEELDEALIKADKHGKKIFSTFIKGKPIYKQKHSTYRTYTIKGISGIYEIYLKKEILSEQLGIPLKK
jgi:hypothetical protein